MNKISKLASVCVFAIVLAYSCITSDTSYVVQNKEYLFPTELIEQYAPYFEEASVEFGVPASLLMAMAIKETSFGTKGVGKNNNNLFGVGKGSAYPTPEAWLNDKTKRFEIYPDVQASIRDAARILGDPNSYYKLTNILINAGDLNSAYTDIAKGMTNGHWCVPEPGYPCYDAASLIAECEKYGLFKYDEKLKAMSTDDLKAILEKYYGPNAIKIPGYDKVADGWDGKFTLPNLDNNNYSGIYFSTDYSGDITKGFLYKRYSETDMYQVYIDVHETDDAKVNNIIKNIFLQGEKLYGDGQLHLSEFQFNGTSIDAPIANIGDVSFVDGGIPLACYSKITSAFGSQESFRTAKHKGMDMSAPAGTAIYSVTDGTVVKTYGGCPAVGHYGDPCGGGRKNQDGTTIGGYGNFVKIKADNGMYFVYAHMYTTPLVTVGQRVVKGQQIGIVGSSGSSTGNHLHFEAHDTADTKINPTPYSNYQSIPHC